MNAVKNNTKALVWALALMSLLVGAFGRTLAISGEDVHSARLSRPHTASECNLANPLPIFHGGTPMNNDHSRDHAGDFLFDKGERRYNSLEPDKQFLRLEDELRRRLLIFDPHVQWLLDKYACGSQSNEQWVREELQKMLEADRIMDMRTGSVFRPLAPSKLLQQGDLHLFNQVDGTPWKISRDALTRGVLLTGPQGGGKTRLLIWLCRQLCSFDPPIPFFIIDPKQELAGWADHLNATYITLDENCGPVIGIDLSPPPGLSDQAWLTSLMPLLGETIGVIFGVEILQDAAITALAKLEGLRQSGEPGQLCLGDIHEAVQFVNQTSSGRRAGYKDAALTGIARILRGSGNLFRCRQGIDLAGLFQGHNVILGGRAITDEFAAKFLTVYFIWYLHELERFSPATSALRRVLILDDATRSLSARSGFDASSGTSSFTNIFATLRSSGNGVITTTQIPHLADPGILALSHTIICVGGLHYAQDTRLLAQMMSLNPDQQQAITKLSQQEAIGISAGSAWPGVVHGFTPNVPDIPEAQV